MPPTSQELSDKEALRQSEERFRLLVESVKEYAILMLDPEGYVTSWNAGAERIKGYHADEIVGQHFSRFYSPADAERRKPMEELKAALQKGRYEEEALRIRKDGSQFWASVVITPIFDSTGRLTGFAKVTRDITERKQAEEVLARHAADLARSNEELVQFAYVASHDLQEPLRKILAFGDRLSAHSGTGLDEQGRDYLDRMQNAARRMEQLIESLLELSRVTTKGRVLEAVDLNKVLSEVVSDLEVRIQQTGGRVEAEQLPTLVADRSQMHQLFQNLIGNALKFHRENVPPVVRIRSLRGANAAWEIHIADNGIGFEEKYLDRIFRPFQRLHAKNVFEGSGMGLAICNRIVAGHSGRITAHSQPGIGSEFIVTLPALPMAKEAKTS